MPQTGNIGLVANVRPAPNPSRKREGDTTGPVAKLFYLTGKCSNLFLGQAFTNAMLSAAQ
jgi:hypothetical protein